MRGVEGLGARYRTPILYFPTLSGSPPSTTRRAPTDPDVQDSRIRLFRSRVG